MDSRTAEQVERAEWIERAAYCDLLACGGSPLLQRRLGLSVAHCGPSLVLRSRGVDSLLFNRAFGLEVGLPDAGSLAESIVARYRAQDIGRYLLHLSAALPDGPLRPQLASLGLARYPRSWHVLVRGREPVRQAVPRWAPWSVERASRRDAVAVAMLMLAGFELPDCAGPVIASSVGAPRWHTYIARDDAGALAAAMLMYADAELAHVTMMATASGHRRRGAQCALLAQGLSVALDLGCRQISAETGVVLAGEPNPSHDNLERAGFRVAHLRENWAPRGTRWSAAEGTRVAK